ncbi:MAG: oxygenase MpaB family protein [Kineosporiaceae bacterium]
MTIRHPSPERPERTGPLAAVGDRAARGFRRIVSGRPDGSPEWVTALAEGDDEGYFGPGSAAWAVHGDLATLVGGIRALLLQALHPAAVTGVDRHSTYRDDPLGRLAGTTRWLTVTTFGSRHAADREAARVRGMHRRVTGTFVGADGAERPYRAGDDDLLTWVHVAFTDSFLTAHERFGSAVVPGGADAYVAEWATAGRLVGVGDPPTTAAGLRARIDAYAPDLGRSEATARTLAFLRRPPLPPPARAAYAVLLAGAVSTLDPGHRELLGLRHPRTPAARTAAQVLLRGMRSVLGDGPPVAVNARRRIAALDATPTPGPHRVPATE